MLLKGVGAGVGIISATHSPEQPDVLSQYVLLLLQYWPLPQLLPLSKVQQKADWTSNDRSVKSTAVDVPLSTAH